MKITGQKFTLQLISSVDDLAALRAEWFELWTRIADATPFQAPQWLIPWWRHLGAGELCVFVLRSAGRLIGLVPSAIQHERGHTMRKFALMGSGVSDYLDALFEPQFRRVCAQQTLANLERLTPRWDLCEFAQLRPDSPLFEAHLPIAWRGGIVLHEPCLILPIDSNARTLADVIPAHQAANVKYYQARAAHRGRLEYTTATAANLDDALQELFRLHDARWQRSGGAGVLQGAPIKLFHRAVAEEMLASGLLRLHLVGLDGHTIAVHYGFTHNRRAYYYLGGFDPDFSAFSPGTLAIAYAIEQALAEGVTTFDFLRGRERYKYLWGAVESVTYRRRLSYVGVRRDPASAIEMAQAAQ